MLSGNFATGVFTPLFLPAVSGDLAGVAKWWPADASWGWNAISGTFMKDGKPASQSDALSFARSSAAYLNTSNVAWVSVAADVLRDNGKGVRLEPAATNKLTSPNDLTGTGWFLSGTATRAITAIAAPAGGFFTRVNRGSESNAQLISQTVAGAVPGQDNVVSIYVMADGDDIGKLAILEIKRGAGATFVNAIRTITMTDKPQRVSVSFKPAADTTSIAVAIKVDSVRLPTSILVANAQLEVGTKPSTPISGTRSADVASLKFDAPADLEITFAEMPRYVEQPLINFQGVTYNTDRSDYQDAVSILYWDGGVLEFKVGPGYRYAQDQITNERSEFSTSVRFGKGVSVGNAFQMMVPDGFTPSAIYGEGEWFIVAQWHGDQQDGRSPYIAFSIQGGDLVIDKRHYVVGTGYSAPVELYRESKFSRNEWNDWVVEHNVHATTGYVRVWKNGVQVVNFTGPVGYWDHPTGGFHKVGIYRSAADFDGKVRFQNLSEGIADVAARVTTRPTFDEGRQVIEATPTDGVYVLDAATLNHSVVSKIVAVPA